MQAPQTPYETNFLQALQHDSSILRQQAIKRLAKSATDTMLHQLLQALHDDKFWVRARAAEALGQIGAASAIPPLLQAITDANRTVRKQAAKALARFGSVQDMEQLEESLGPQALIEILDSIDTTAVVTTLLRLLNTHQSPLRELAIAALVHIGSEAAITGLLKAAYKSDIPIRTQIVAHLVNQTSLPTCDVLHPVLRHPNYAFRWQAAQTLWDLQGSRAVDDIRLVLQDQALSANDHVKEDQSAIPPCSEIDEYVLVDALSNGQFRMGWEMARAITQFDTHYAIYVLERALDLSWA